MGAALDGLKVIELGNAVSAPFCAALLADFGASVIKIESPKGGDMLRGMGNYKDLWFAVENRNKKNMKVQKLIWKILYQLELLA